MEGDLDKSLMHVLHDFERLSFFSFFLFCSISDGKCCFSVRKSILTSERHAEHPFAGQNTQHERTKKVKIITIASKIQKTVRQKNE